MPVRYVIRFIAYRMNWSIVRVAEWLLARDYEQYISAYREGEDSKYYEINDINDIDDIATSYLLKRTLDMGHSAICSEGEKEDNKNFYKAYYKMKNINNHHILDELGLDFNEIYDFSFYNTDTKGFVTAINKKLSDITDVLIIPTPSVTPTKSDPYEQYLVELNQLRINNIRNNPNTNSIEQQLVDAQNQIEHLEKQLARADKPADSATSSNIDMQNVKKAAIKQFNRSLATVLIELDYRNNLRKGDIAEYIVPYMKELAFVLADEDKKKADNLTVSYDTLYNTHLKNLDFKKGRQSNDDKNKVNIDLLFKKQLPVTE